MIQEKYIQKMNQETEHEAQRLRGFLRRECPKGHYRFYWYLYFRENGKLKKEYVKPTELRALKRALKQNKRRKMKRKPNSVNTFSDFLS